MSILLAITGPLESEILVELAQARPPIAVARRCADHAEVLGAARAGLGTVAVVEDADLAFVESLHRCGVRVVGIGPSGAARHRGFDALCSPHASEVRACIAHMLADPLEPANDAEESGRAGRLIAVWGTNGAPGRSTLARDLAAALAAAEPAESETARSRRWRFAGRAARVPEAASAPSVLLVDADTVSPSLAQLLSLNQESSALAVAARKINLGEASSTLLPDLCVPVAGFDFLAGFNRGNRWREMPEPVARELFAQAKRGWDHVVADCAPGIERSEYGYDSDRDCATLELLDAADDVLLVGRASPVGIRRLLERFDEAADIGIERLHVVVNRVRRGRFAEAEEREIGALLAERGVEETTWIRDDDARYSQAELRGLVLREVAPACPAAADVAGLAARLLARGSCVEDEGTRDRSQARLPVAVA